MTTSAIDHDVISAKLGFELPTRLDDARNLNAAFLLLRNRGWSVDIHISGQGTRVSLQRNKSAVSVYDECGIQAGCRALQMMLAFGFLEHPSTP